MKNTKCFYCEAEVDTIYGHPDFINDSPICEDCEYDRIVGQEEDAFCEKYGI